MKSLKWIPPPTHLREKCNEEVIECSRANHNSKWGLGTVPMFGRGRRFAVVISWKMIDDAG